ncbi:hypothetical protein [Nitrincola iocasae]|uniref:Uncharacterized protein n=1 Tax=Nitrincola iocasae TaxID=2614693 RepID=A0A5J6LH36_9GAMM|nr:hypothetical protein [Nitrincola iocasae]QEW08000.1 hypothetical protein F5I99_16720 [Nitrincola iocasae]
MPNTMATCTQSRQLHRSIQQRLERQLIEEFRLNASTLIVLNLPHMLSVWVESKRQTGLSNDQISEAFAQLESNNPSLPQLIFESSGYKLVQDNLGTLISTAMDSRVLRVMIEDFRRSGNLLGDYRITQGNGRYHVIFKGNHKLRTLVKGTRYLVSNPLMIQLGIASPAEMLKGAAKNNAYITLIISSSGNGFKWIFDETYIWTHFISNISIDLMKAALAVLAWVATMYVVKINTSRVILAKGAGLFIGFVAGYGAGRVSNESIQEASSQMAQDIAQTYVQVYGAISNPVGVITETGERAKDILICSADAAIERIDIIIQDNINRAIRPYINPIHRFY